MTPQQVTIRDHAVTFDARRAVRSPRLDDEFSTGLSA
jgi:hypothetical protein